MIGRLHATFNSITLKMLHVSPGDYFPIRKEEEGNVHVISVFHAAYFQPEKIQPFMSAVFITACQHAVFVEAIDHLADCDSSNAILPLSWQRADGSISLPCV